MGDYTPKFRPGADVTYQVATSAVTGGNIVELGATAGLCAFTTGASAKVLGVANTDAAVGDKVSVSRGGVQRVIAGGTVAVGDPVKSAANGRAVLYVVGTDPITQFIGVALTAATVGNSFDVQWKA